nr:glutamate receptor ionotropic, delta-2-like [Penaeus vannamei]
MAQASVGLDSATCHASMDATSPHHGKRRNVNYLGDRSRETRPKANGALRTSVSPQKDVGAQSLLSEVLAGPLDGDKILLFLDSGASQVIDVDLLLREIRLTTSVILVDLEEPEAFLRKAPNRLIRGSFVTVVLAFTRSPAPLLDSLGFDWNPDFLLFLSLNGSLDTAPMLEDERVQRSKYMTLIEYGRRASSTFHVFTSRPFRPTRTGYAIKSPIGAWNKLLFATKSKLFPERFATLDGAVLQLGSWCDDFPFLYSEGDGCVGSTLELLDVIAAQLNFSYVVQMEPEDQNWGSKENGTWTGMLGDLVYNGKDLVVNSLLLTEQPFAEFDSTYPYHMESYAFILEIPPPVPQWRGLLYPFTKLMWGAIIGTTLAVIVLLQLCLAVAPDTQDASQVFLLVSSGSVWAGVVRQSVKHSLGTSWTRLWAGFWWLATLIITTGYTSNLVAFLTVPVYPKRIETVDQLAASKLRICMQDYGSFLPDALRVSADPALRHLGESLDLFPYVYLSFEQGFEWVAEGTHALVETYSYLSYQQSLHNHTGHTYIMKENMIPGYYVWYMKRNCPYSSVISRSLTRLLETGFVQRFYLKHMKSDMRSDGARRSQQKSAGSPIQIGQLWGAFMVWAIGLACALLARVLETAVSVGKRRSSYSVEGVEEAGGLISRLSIAGLSLASQLQAYLSPLNCRLISRLSIAGLSLASQLQAYLSPLNCLLSASLNCRLISLSIAGLSLASAGSLASQLQAYLSPLNCRLISRLSIA